MVAIYVSVPQPAEQVYLHVPHAFHLDRKIAFMLRALHACNETKDNKITCLGTAVTYHRRCRNPLRTTKWMAVLAEMVEAAKDPYALLGDLRFMAPSWAGGLSCYLHGAQKGVAMAALGAVAVYRLEAMGGIAVPGLLDVWKFALSPGPSGYFAQGHASFKTKQKAAECSAKPVEDSDAVSEVMPKAAKYPAKDLDESDIVSEGLLNAAKSPAKNTGESDAVSEGLLYKVKTQQAKMSHLLFETLLAFVEAVLGLCLCMLLLYFSVLLLCESILLMLRSK